MYTLLLKQNGFYNVIRSDKPRSRIEAIKRATPLDVEVIRVVDGDNRDKIRKALGNPVGEWFTIEPNKISKVLEKYNPIEEANYLAESETSFTAPMDYYTRVKLHDIQETLGIGGTRQTVFQLAIEALYQQLCETEVDDCEK